jgi:hypothetical protein
VLDLLWVVDVDGVPLVIDAAVRSAGWAQVRAELLQVVESIRIRSSVGGDGRRADQRRSSLNRVRPTGSARPGDTSVGIHDRRTPRYRCWWTLRSWTTLRASASASTHAFGEAQPERKGSCLQNSLRTTSPGSPGSRRATHERRGPAWHLTTDDEVAVRCLSHASKVVLGHRPPVEHIQPEAGTRE